MEYDRAGVAAHAKNLANKVKGGLEGSLKTLGVEVVDATGELAGANTVKAVETGKTFTAKDIILAPGSLPFVPPGVQVWCVVSWACLDARAFWGSCTAAKSCSPFVSGCGAALCFDVVCRIGLRAYRLAMADVPYTDERVPAVASGILFWDVVRV